MFAPLAIPQSFAQNRRLRLLENHSLFSCTLAMVATLFLVFFIELAMNLPSLFRSFDIERSDGRSSLTLHISVAGQ